MFSRGKIKDKTAVFPRKTQGKAKNTKENHAKSVQNVRKLLFSLGKTKEKQNKKKKTPPPQKKKDPQKKSTRSIQDLKFTRNRSLHMH